MLDIHFFREDIEADLPSEATKQWVSKIIDQHDKQLNTLNFIFCSDTFLHQLNLEYLHHDTYTDIVTFDNSEDDKEIEGDIFISLERISDNSNNFKIPFDEELHRVMIHGVLHLLGFGDKTEKEQQLMRNKENECLALRF